MKKIKIEFDYEGIHFVFEISCDLIDHCTILDNDCHACFFCLRKVNRALISASPCISDLNVQKLNK
jgi:hypothetical protein